MVEAGQWRVTRPDVQGHAGFRLTPLVSLLANASWGTLAVKWSHELRQFTFFGGLAQSIVKQKKLPQGALSKQAIPDAIDARRDRDATASVRQSVDPFIAKKAIAKVRT